MKRRMLDGGIWANEKFAELPCMARLLQIGLVTLADDQGRIKAHPAYLRSQIFPYDDVAITDVVKWLGQIMANGTIIYYEVDGKNYIQLVNWWEYQSLQYASPSEHPRPQDWQDRIRYNAKGHFTLTYNWATVNGDLLPDTCDQNGDPLPVVATLPPRNPGGRPPRNPPGFPGGFPPENINKDQYKNNINKEGESARTHVASPEPTAKKVRVKSAHLDPRHFVNGYIPEGTGANAVEVYYERFSINQDSARLNAIKEDDLARLCTDLGKLREVVTAYSRTSFQPGNVQLILDWYNTGIPDKHKPPGQARNGALGDEEKAALRTRARLAMRSLESATKFKTWIDPTWQADIEKAKGAGVL